MLRRSRLLAARIAQAAVDLSELVKANSSWTAKSGVTYTKVVTECEFSCYQPAIVELRCGCYEEEEHWNPGRAACQQHLRITRIRCDNAGKRGCPVLERAPLSEEEKAVVYDEQFAFEAVRMALIGAWGEYGPLMAAHVEYQEEVSKETVVAETPVELTPLGELQGVETPIATKRKNRGGVRNKAKREGYCYLKAVPKVMRAEAEKRLGAYPYIGSVLDFYDAFCIQPRNLAIEIGYACHMVRSVAWPFHIQRRYLDKFHRYNRVGAMDVELMYRTLREVESTLVFYDEDYLAKIIYPYHPGLIREVAPHVAIEEERELTDVKGKSDIALSAEISEEVEDPFGEETEYLDDIASPAEPEEEAPWQEEVPVLVGAGGSCWMAAAAYGLPKGVSISDPSTWDKVKVSDFIPVVEATIAAKVYTSWNYEISKDGDFHLNEVVAVPLVTLNAMPPERREAYKRFPKGSVFLKLLQENMMKPNPVVNCVKQVPVLVGDDRSAWSAAMRRLNTVENQAMLEKEVATNLRKSYDQAAQICPWHVEPAAAVWMNDLKLDWNEEFVTPHPHPIHAATRNWCYKKEMPKVIRGDCTFISMKEDHFLTVVEALERYHGKGTYRYKLISPIVSNQDLTRFQGEPAATRLIDPAEIDTDYVWFDESGHYLEAQFMERLAEIKTLKFVGYSSIFPLCSLSYEKSPHPEYADWRITSVDGKPMLIYAPDGDWGNKYTQPFDPTMILARSFTAADGARLWNGGVVSTKGHTRLHLFSRDDLAPESHIAFTEKRYMQLPKVFVGQPELPPILVKDYLAMFLYLRGVGSTDPKNMAAKLRNMMFHETLYVTPAAMDWVITIMIEVCRLKTVNDLEPVSYNDAWGEIRHKTWGRVKEAYDKAFTLRYMYRNMDLTAHADPVILMPTLDVQLEAHFGTNLFHAISWKLSHSYEFWEVCANWVMYMGGVNSVTRKVVKGGAKIIFPFAQKMLWKRKSYGYRFKEDEHERAEPIVRGPIRVIPGDFKPGYALHSFEEVAEEVEEDDIFFDAETFDEGPEESKGVDKGKARETPNTINEWIAAQNAARATNDLVEVDMASVSDVTAVTEAVPMTQKMLDEAMCDAPKHGTEIPCDICPSRDEYLQKGGVDDETEFQLMCGMLHSAASHPNQTTAKLARQMVEKDAYNVKTGDGFKEDRMIIEGVNLKEPSHYLPPEIVQMALIPQKKMEESYEKRAEEWAKVVRKRPRMEVFKNHFTGESLWNAKFPKSEGHRFEAVPYRRLLEFPHLGYPKEDCLITALCEALSKSPGEILFHMCSFYPAGGEISEPVGLPLDAIWPVTLHYGVAVHLLRADRSTIRSFGVNDARGEASLILMGDHVICWKTLSALVIRQKRRVFLGPKTTALVKRLDKWPALQWYDWIPEATRAGTYVRALIARTTGLLGEPINAEALRGWGRICDMPPSTDKKICVVMGDPGSRKSSFPQKAMLDIRDPYAFVMVSATKVLAQDWRDKVDASGKIHGKVLPGPSITTFEVALARGISGKVAIYDENKYPKGYIALHNLLNPEIEYSLFLCDPWQASWHEPNADCILNEPHLAGEAELYQKYAKQYLVGTWRFGGFMACFWRLPSFSNKPGSVAFTDIMPSRFESLRRYWPNVNDETLRAMWGDRLELYAAHADTMWADQIRQYTTNTYAGSQGLGAALVVMEVDERMIRGGDVRLIYAAMTRGNYYLLVRKWVENGPNQQYVYNHPVFQHLEAYRLAYVPGHDVQAVPEHTVSIRDITFSFSPGIPTVLAGPPEKLTNLAFVHDFMEPDQLDRWIDPDEGTKEVGSRLVYDDPRFNKNLNQAFFNVNVEPMVLPVEEKVVALPLTNEGVVPITSVPIANIQSFKECAQDSRVNREVSEIHMPKYGTSTQLPDWKVRRKDAVDILREATSKLKGKERAKARNALLNLPPEESPLYSDAHLLNMGLNQQSSDQVSFQAAKKQRVNWASPDANKMDYLESRDFSEACSSALFRYLGWTEGIPWDPNLFDQCVVDFQERRGSKSVALTMAAMNRADPDFGIMLTAKTQIKLKKRDSEIAKPLQTIVIHSDAYLYEHGPYGIYFLRQLMRHKPDYWCFYAEMNPDDLESWCNRNFPKGCIFHMSDMTAQDQSMRGWAVGVLEAGMKHFNFPKPFVKEFVREKFNKSVNGRNMRTMTNSGEIWTFIINTFGTAAREAFMYSLPPRVPMANGGDDVKRLAGFPLNPVYVRRFQKDDPCVDKRYESKVGEFVSFRYFAGVLVKDPIILLRRLLAKMSIGDHKNCALGYYQLWAENYKKKDLLYDIFDEWEMEAHAILTRIFMNMKDYDLHKHIPRHIMKGLGNPAAEKEATRSNGCYNADSSYRTKSNDQYNSSGPYGELEVSGDGYGHSFQDTGWEGLY